MDRAIGLHVNKFKPRLNKRFLARADHLMPPTIAVRAYGVGVRCVTGQRVVRVEVGWARSGS